MVRSDGKSSEVVTTDGKLAQTTGYLALLRLLAFRDVPWNGPWYRRQGFAEMPGSEWGPEVRRHWQAEIDAGLHALGPRLVMYVPGT